MENRKRLVVLVGTSVFSSATWRLDDETSAFARGLRDDVEWHAYCKWLELPYRHSPMERATECFDFVLEGRRQLCRGRDVSAWLEERTRAAPEEMQLLVASDLDSLNHSPLRFSAEIATLLAYKAGQDHTSTLGDFLSNRYESVDLLYSEVDETSAHAASVVGNALDLLTDQSGVRIRRSPQIKGPKLLEQSVSITHYLFEALRQDHVHLVVSGGFKVFAVMAGHALGQLAGTQREEHFKVIYLHEESELVDFDPRIARSDTERVNLTPLPDFTDSR